MIFGKWEVYEQGLRRKVTRTWFGFVRESWQTVKTKPSGEWLPRETVAWMNEDRDALLDQMTHHALTASLLRRGGPLIHFSDEALKAELQRRGQPLPPGVGNSVLVSEEALRAAQANLQRQAVEAYLGIRAAQSASVKRPKKRPKKRKA